MDKCKRQYYMDCYINNIEEERKLYIQSHGNDDNFDYQDADSIESIVGYYLFWYKNNALDMWLINLKKKHISNEMDKAITLKLKYLFNN